MKGNICLILPFLVLFFCGCKKDKDDILFFPQELTTVKDEIVLSFDSLTRSITDVVDFIEQTGVDTALVRAKLLELYTESSFSREFVYTTPQGILQIIEPAAYYSYQGADVSNQPHVIKAFQTLQPVLSDAFMVVEGYQAAVDMHPIVNVQLLGAISAVFAPEDPLRRIITPVVKNQAFEIWVMEKTGVVLFDQDGDEIGLNVLTDPLYVDYPELIAACYKMIAEETGETTYSFYQTGTSSVVKKRTFWNTFALHGNEWKIVWVIPE